jgi:hypothetical protein
VKYLVICGFLWRARVGVDGSRWDEMERDGARMDGQDFWCYGYGLRSSA